MKMPYKFSDCESVEDIARLLDDVFSRYGDELFGVAPGTVFGAQEVVMVPNGSAPREGMLVASNGNGTVTVANVAGELSATHVVTKVYGGRRCQVALMALVEAPARDGERSFPAYLYLSANGNSTTVIPSSGLIQRVGMKLYYDASRNKNVCLFYPCFDLGTL